MKKIANSLLLTISMYALQVSAAEAPKADAKSPQATLQEQLQALESTNTLPAAANREKLYAVQSRYLPLRFKHEFTLGGASNLTPDSFLATQQFEVGYRFHFNDRWALGLNQAWVSNTFKDAVNNIRTADGAVPDVPFAYSRSDMMLEMNIFYGKFRWTAETVSYFDVYAALGPGMVRQNTGTTGAAVGDLGFAAWLGQWGSVRMGLKDYYYKQTYRTGAQMAHNIHAHLDIGYIF